MQPRAVSPQVARPPLGPIAWGMTVNTVVPVIFYKLSKRYYSPSEFTAIVVAALFPLGKSAFDLLHSRQLDPVSVVVLLGIMADGVALLFGGSPTFCCSANPYLPGFFGLACFASLLLSDDVLLQPLFRGWHRSTTTGQVQLRMAVSGGTFLPPADNHGLGVRICRRAIRPPCSHPPVACCTGFGDLTNSARSANHRHHDLAFSYGHRVRLRALSRLSQLGSQNQGRI